MRKGKGIVLVTLALVAVLAVAALLGACGKSKSTTSTSSPTASTAWALPNPMNGQLTGTATANFTQVLGHAPTGLAAKIAQRGSIIIANDPNYAPQSYVDPKTKQLVGMDVDSAKAAAQILGLKIKWVHPTWEDIPANLQTGAFDVSVGSMTDTKDREKTVSFTQPYYFTPAQVFVKKGGTQITGPRGPGRKEGGRGRRDHLLDLPQEVHQGRREDVHHRPRGVPAAPQRPDRLLDDGGSHRPRSHQQGQADRVLGQARCSTRLCASPPSSTSPTSSRC